MSSVLKHGPYTARVEYSAEDRVFFGKLDDITDLVSFEGSTVEELETAFLEAVEDYLALCAANNKQPDKPFKGSFNVRMQPELHRQAALASRERNMSLNQLVVEAVRRFV
jgi:predicted HicB family RNase H-like nuclease